MNYRLLRHFDAPLVLSTLSLLLLGLAMIYSASYSQDSGSSWSSWDSPVARQIIYAGIGLVLMVVAASVDYRFYGNIAPLIYGAVIALLSLVLATGESTYGARRWIDLALFPVQPSELAKLSIILVTAKFLSDREERVGDLRVLIQFLLLMGFPAALVFLQPALGTTLVFGGIWLGMAIVSGIRLLHLGLLLASGALAAPVAYLFLLRPYMQERVLTFLDPTRDPLGAGYNVIQSEISVGSGGLWGKGFLEGTQSHLEFLRIQSSDFIFSVLGEELGFVGALILFALYIALLVRGIRAAYIARDTFGRLIVTGIPLPLISHGGSSLITTLVSLGLLQSIVIRHRRLEF
ncbi:MAG: Rod shape-determining protein RodA [Dehalococcoidia bacterium]|nr:Rod shape-determining protein RodA [Dehalococcoidia bacterium]